MVAQVEQAGFNRFLFVTSRLQRQLQGLVQATRRSNRPVDSQQFGQLLPPEPGLGLLIAQHGTEETRSLAQHRNNL
jgi:hypothetical protein